MKKIYHNGIILHTLVLLIITVQGNFIFAQQASIKHLSPKHQQYYDSLKNMNYNYTFPILGDKVYKKGFDIPFPFGIMLNTFYGKQDMDITNVRVGINSGDSSYGPIDLSQVIKFSEVNAEAYNLNLRLDAWVLPFLNVYALLNYFPKTTTSVTLSEPVTFSSGPTQQGSAFGFGIMGAGGVGPVWIQGDYNMTWANMELLENTVFTQIVGLRMGHVFPSKTDAEKNFSIWIGTMGIFLNNNTVGEVALSEVFSGISQDKIDEIKNSYDSWYNTLTKPQQAVMDKIVERIQDKVDGINVDDASITYQLDKAPAARWAGLIGAQYQINKRWQLRAESNCIGYGRKSILFSINYRFLGFKKNQSP